MVRPNSGAAEPKSIITCMARLSLLTPERSTAVVDLVRRGVPVPTAAEAVGVSRATVREWLRRGEDRDDRPSAEAFATFATDLRQAEALAIGDAVSKITTAGTKNGAQRPGGWSGPTRSGMARGGLSALRRPERTPRSRWLASKPSWASQTRRVSRKWRTIFGGILLTPVSLPGCAPPRVPGPDTQPDGDDHEHAE